MSDKCPKCGAKRRTTSGGGNPNVTSIWECGTYRGAGEKIDETEACLRRQLATLRTELAEARAVGAKLRKAWSRADEYGPVDDGSPGSRAAKRVLDYFREAAEAAASADTERTRL